MSSSRIHGIEQALRSTLLGQRGDNRPLAQEISEKLSPQAKERLYRVFQDMQDEASSERRKRKQGRFW